MSCWNKTNGSFCCCGGKIMCEEKYSVIGKFNCCGKSMVTVIMSGTACVMTELEYNRIIEAERKFGQINKCRESA